MAFKGDFGQGPEMLRELWLYHFMEKEEREQLLHWLAQEGLSRPEAFDNRVKHADYLRNLGNEWFQKGDYRRALHCSLGAVHCLDYPPLWQQDQSEEQRRQLAQGMLPVMGNVAMICLKRGDFQSACTAASSGLLVAKKLPEEATAVLRSKLHYRRALCTSEQGPQRDYDAAHADLVEAAQLDPTNSEIRQCLKTCKELRQQERQEASKRGPRYKPAGGGAKEDCGSQCQETQEPGPPVSEPAELSAPLELFACCVGRSLGLARRWSRYARHGWQNGTARLRSLTFAEAWPSILVCCGLLAFTTSVYRVYVLAAPSFVSNASFCLFILLQVYFVFRLMAVPPIPMKQA